MAYLGPQKKTNIHTERRKAKHFLKKYKIRALKFIVLALKLYIGTSKSRGQDGFLLKSAKRCIRDSPYLGQRGGPWPP